jgi:hypothetical protein
MMNAAMPIPGSIGPNANAQLWLKLKFQKSANFLLSKYKLWYQKYAEFHANSKTVEKTTLKRLQKSYKPK